MIDFNKNNTLTILSILILVLGFQNCGDSTFQNVDIVQNMPADSLLTNDTKFRGGLNFTVTSLNENSNNLEQIFSIQRHNDNDYKIDDQSTSFVCAFADPNSSEELLQLTEITRLTHPSLVSTSFDTCDSSDGKNLFYAIGSQSPIYLTFKDEDEDCYSGDPQKLLDKNLRVFIVENLFISDVEDLLTAVEQDVLNDSNCAAFSKSSD